MNWRLFFSRWAYYLRSIPTILLGMSPRLSIIRKFIGILSEPLIITLKTGERFKVRSAMDIWVIKETCLDRDYEVHGVPLRDGWVLIDIGGGLGDFSISTKHRFPKSRILAFEPFPESYTLFQENMALNQLDDIQIFPNAVGGEAGELQLETSTGVAVKHSPSDKEGDMTVRSVTLAQVFDEQNIEQCDFLKMDCEGGEYAILLNTPENILRRTRYIAMEYHDNLTEYTHKTLVMYLKEKNFRVVVTPNPAHSEIGFLYAENLNFEGN